LFKDHNVFFVTHAFILHYFRLSKYRGSYTRLTSLFKENYIMNGNNIFQHQYNPQGYFNFIDTDLASIETNISTSSIGERLKEIAGI
jgi:hypothetical protein